MNDRQNTDSSLKLCSWNIGGLRDKLQNEDILNFVLGFDIVWLLETKYYFNVQVPGFTIYHNVSREGYHRGGVMMLVKHTIMNYKLSTNVKISYISI